MPEYYDLVSYGTAPVSLADTRSYLKANTADDTIIQSLIDAATEYGESYTGREFRANTWKLLIDGFTNPITLRRNPVASVTHVKYLVSGVLTTVSSSVYWLKKLQQCAEIQLDVDQSWPSDIDEREQNVEIQFVTAAYTRGASRIRDAIMRHVAYLYANRGDCEESGGVNPLLHDSARKSGATSIYDQFRISRV